MIKSNLCDYSDAYILVKGNMSVENMAPAGAAANNNHKNVIFKICIPFTDCIIEINNTQIDNANGIDYPYSLWAFLACTKCSSPLKIFKTENDLSMKLSSQNHV